MSLTLSNSLLVRLQTDPVFNEDATLKSCVVAAFFGQNLIDDSTKPATVTPQPWDTPTLIDYVKDADKTVTFEVNGKSYTLPYRVIGAGLVAAATQEKDA